MASLILPETSEKLSRDSCFPSKHEMDKSLQLTTEKVKALVL